MGTDVAVVVGVGVTVGGVPTGRIKRVMDSLGKLPSMIPWLTSASLKRTIDERSALLYRYRCARPSAKKLLTVKRLFWVFVLLLTTTRVSALSLLRSAA